MLGRIDVIINKRSFEYFMCLDLVDSNSQLFLLTIVGSL